MDFKSVGINIRKYRTAKKISQEQLAEMAYLSPKYIGMVERAEKTPSLTTLVNIANALDVTADMLLCDVLNRHSEIKSSLLIDKINSLSEKDKNRIYAVIDILLEHSE
ncbi:MAG: helix-turn-helix domain-containing protein [Ruminococcus flavefaciens]|nr:helix-turn-helix domain-containing protein [Ruminococcus flavefaciens]MCM1228873.1 helix-turn-helix domain-containing protein [Ruminococcus flavefaciens]